MIATGSTVVDVGITRVPDDDGTERQIGDVDVETVAPKASALSDLSGVDTRTTGGEKVSVAPEVVVTVAATRDGPDATEIVRQLRRETPRVFVGADGLDDGVFTVNPTCLDSDEASYVVERIRATATAK